MKKIISCLLALILLAVVNAPVNITAAENSGSTASSQKYVLEIDEFCILRVKDKNGTVVWASNPDVDKESVEAPIYNNMMSQLIVSYFDDEQKEAVIGSYLSSVNRSTATVSEIKNGYRIEYNFSRKQEQFVIPVEYVLSEKGITAEVILSDITESGDSYISSISLLPYAMIGTPEDEGYLLIPDGSGALVDFKCEGSSAEYSARVYGRDLALSYNFDEGNKNSVYMPVYGIKKQNQSCLAEITGNPEAAEIEAEKSSGKYVRVYSSFIYREYDTALISGASWQYNEYPVTAETTATENFKVKFSFLDNEKSDYADMAELYRRELIEKYGLELLDSENSYNIGIKAYGITSKKSSFLGIPYSKKIVATDFDDLTSLNSGISENGGENTAYILKDFATPSSVKNYPKKVQIASIVGGEKGLSKLSKAVGGKGVFAEYNLMFENVGAFLFLKEGNLATKLSKNRLQKETYGIVTYASEGESSVYALNKKSLTNKTTKFLRKAAKFKSADVAFADFGKTLYSDFNEKNPTLRNVMRESIEEILKSGKNSAVQGGNIYAAAYSDAVYDIPVSSSGFDIESESVPFYQTVLKGYVNMISEPINLFADSTYQLLLCVDSGTAPAFAVTGASNSDLVKTGYNLLYNTQIEVLSEEIVNTVSGISEIFSAVSEATVTLKLRNNNLSVTEYSNGVTVLVNFGNSPKVYKGVLVSPESYTYIK